MEIIMSIYRCPYQMAFLWIYFRIISGISYSLINLKGIFHIFETIIMVHIDWIQRPYVHINKCVIWEPFAEISYAPVNAVLIRLYWMNRTRWKAIIRNVADCSDCWTHIYKWPAYNQFWMKKGMCSFGFGLKINFIGIFRIRFSHD